jgi:hypothetical protein
MEIEDGKDEIKESEKEIEKQFFFSFSQCLTSSYNVKKEQPRESSPTTWSCIPIALPLSCV